MVPSASDERLRGIRKVRAWSGSPPGSFPKEWPGDAEPQLPFLLSAFCFLLSFGVGFGLPCPAFLHSAFYILPLPRGGFGAAWTENGRPRGICRRIRLHVNNQPTKTVNINLGLDGAAVVRRRAPLENKRETRATQEQHKSNTRATQEEHKRNTREQLPCSCLAGGLHLACTWLWAAFCILHFAFRIRLGVALPGLAAFRFQLSGFIPHP